MSDKINYIHRVTFGNFIKQHPLIPMDGQKSYYYKAIVEQYQVGDDATQRIIVLRSYDRPVLAVLYHNELGAIAYYKLWEGWSQTTAKHIKSFAKIYGLGPIHIKRTWDELPLHGNRYHAYTSGVVSIQEVDYRCIYPTLSGYDKDNRHVIIYKTKENDLEWERYKLGESIEGGIIPYKEHKSYKTLGAAKAALGRILKERFTERKKELEAALLAA